ncbi:DUF4878 domain-containing protein [Paenibacillus tyrfis]|uniref:Uncharacterized protein n=1 Tax=Paenibacillus tyrfis TaxID=1501230 RepID=A0A081P262_9BACL|nr:DUF4878 domain-containing protein [Paenibacillus tyrfis]KEQ24785.1 hypothetical protein ET33_06840 [Paenibacillus tyrfis]
MKQSFKNTLFSLAAVSVLSFNIASVSAVAPAANGAQKPVDAVTNYFNALKSEKIDDMIHHSIDTNYADEASQRKGYTQDFKDDQLLGFEIVSTRTIDDNTAEVNVKLNYKEMRQTPALPFKVIRANDRWKILIEPFEIKLDKTVVKGAPKQFIKYDDNL